MRQGSVFPAENGKRSGGIGGSPSELSCQLLDSAVLLEKSLNCISWLCTVSNPRLCLFVVNLEYRRFLSWVIVAQLFDETSVSWISLISNYDSVERSLLSTHSSESDLYCHCIFTSIKNFIYQINHLIADSLSTIVAFRRQDL